MPTVREYRVAMPLTVEEFHRARQWHKLEQVKLEKRLLEDESMKVTEFGERILVREDVGQIPTYFGQGVKEQLKAEHLVKGYGSDSLCSKPVPFVFLAKVGSFMDIMIANSIRLTEVECWEAYPYFRSVSKNSSLRTSYRMLIEGVCLPGNHTNLQDNPLQLTPEVLKERQLIVVDIAEDVPAEDYRDGKDPVLFRSQKTGRGPLNPSTWLEETQPLMTCAIIISIQFNFLGPLGAMAERKLHSGIERAMRLHHRELFCYIDEWIDENMEEMLKLGHLLQQDVEGIVEVKLGGGTGTTPREEKDEECKSAKKAVAQETEEKVSKANCCPVAYAKKKILEACAAQRCGGSVGYSWLMIGVIACVLGMGVVFMFQGRGY